MLRTMSFGEMRGLLSSVKCLCMLTSAIPVSNNITAAMYGSGLILERYNILNIIVNGTTETERYMGENLIVFV